ncbi:MAG: serine/threonine protein kinase [Oligoflexia bacterium]|nr:serine/threonine protein kinase [Oligoflexia bacterium]
MHKLFFANLLPGTLLFGRFKLDRCLGATHEGGVYLCADVASAGRATAIKILSRHAGNTEEATARLMRELNFSRWIEHPNILRGEEFFVDEDFVAFSMEFIEGGSLANKLEARERFILPRSLHLISQLCDGMSAVHEAGILHRDLKPENVLISADDRVKVSDFGISSSNGAPISPQLRDRILGSLNYLCPEYLADGEYTVRSDLYSLGVITYEVLTGKLPFGGTSFMDALVKRVRFDPLPPHRLTSCVPRPLSHAVMKALSRRPSDRFSSAAELKEAINFIRLPHGIPVWDA